ncbi:Glycerol-3-phosphate regulon repressor [Tritonibacter multivorans]|uniref:Glycerol-3-phosphate regulon repressor n=1 Tax=Tritonibacter multivorans TaxID=928856 RepID=A0A0P1GHF3_9RHOB|nr:DeoR/GlpR family DNA-binding transcription regulator [Tritonibacter multivorans]MDA7420666.1 DeoR/GlpR family DNA-binding transcription regulator [Tritonibacter multivorans]CUH81167.1 Glycerol-3-phosphate regulon repressor [Tritonibacter multivorans]SFC29842.1 transcriptional regulator, DeoR family [Tritonibacter multivorans]
MKQTSTQPKPISQAPATARQAQIAEIVRDQGHAKVDDLATQFSVSTQTIRKDINAMCEKGLLRRVHGGVELSPTTADHYDLRRVLNFSVKREIGQAAAALIPNEATVAVSIGTTPELVVASLGQHHGLHLFTNNLQVAMTAHRFEGAEITIPGGRLRQAEADIVGPSAVAFFDSYRFDIGLFGVAAVSPDGALLDLSEEDVHSREAISRNAETRILVLDSSKFTRKAHACSGHITDVEHVVCNSRPPEALCAMLDAAGVNLVICNEAPQ